MKIKTLMERAQIRSLGKMDNLVQEFFAEFQTMAELKQIARSAKQNIGLDTREYLLPAAAIELKGVFVKNHENNEGEFRAIKRLLHPPITNLLGFSKELKLVGFNLLFMSSSIINFGLTPSLFAFSSINAFDPILLSIQNKSKLGLNFNASKPIDPQPAPISQMIPFFGSSKSAKI